MKTGTLTNVGQHDWVAVSLTANQAYQEMKHYNFEGFPGHPVLKSFVYDYYTKIADSRIADNKSALEANSKIPVKTAAK